MGNGSIWKALVIGAGMAFLAVPPAGAGALTATESAGRAMLDDNCAECHAVGPTGDSTLAEAPPFRDVMARYPAESLAEALAEGIVTGHADMPAFVFEPDEINAIIAYLETLEPTN